MPDCIHQFVNKLSKRVECVSVWTSANNNLDGLCFALTWRFFHLVLYEGYNPIVFERIGYQYNMKSRKFTKVRGDRNRSAIGYDIIHPDVEDDGCKYRLVKNVSTN